MAARGPPPPPPGVRTEVVEAAGVAYTPLDAALASPPGSVVNVVCLAAEVPHPVPSKGSGECVSVCGGGGGGMGRAASHA